MIHTMPWQTPAAYWMQEGPDQDVILSTRIRLARNVSGLPYPNFQTEENAQALLQQIEQIIPLLEESTEYRWQLFRLKDMTESQRSILVDKHLMSPNLSERESQAGLLLREDEAVSIMINEEDHLRIQVLYSGLQLEPAWTLANTLDDLLESRIDFAFSDRYGYKTACPTNAGTGLRASVMVHLPALVMSQKIGPLLTGINQLGMVARGIYGEGTEANGHVFQISNQISMGKPEKEILASLQAIVKQMVAEERQARRLLGERIPLQLRDKVGRALGMVQNSYLMQSQEAVKRWSDLRLGVELNLVEYVSYDQLNRLMVQLQSGWLNQEAAAVESLTPEQRDVLRAKLLRQELREAIMRPMK